MRNVKQLLSILFTWHFLPDPLEAGPGARAHVDNEKAGGGRLDKAGNSRAAVLSPSEEVDGVDFRAIMDKQVARVTVDLDNNSMQLTEDSFLN